MRYKEISVLTNVNIILIIKYSEIVKGLYLMMFFQEHHCRYFLSKYGESFILFFQPLFIYLFIFFGNTNKGNEKYVR